MKPFQTLVLLGVVLLSLTLQANPSIPLDKSDVPDPLKSWIPWALHGHEQMACPFLYNQAQAPICAWATKLDIRLNKTGGRFTQHWQVFAPSWLQLPGNGDHWPQHVRVDGKAMTVVPNQGRGPSIFINKGQVTVEGEFIWTSLPETLTLPAHTGIVALTLDGKSAPFPIIDEQHQLWLSKASDNSKAGESDTLELQVFRKITDNIPLNVQTHLLLKVTGKQREVTLGPVLIQDFIPLALHSQLPAQLERNGMLRVQLRPGVWEVDVVSRSVTAIESLLLQPIKEPWPSQELWVFEARNSYRLVDITNPSIDSRQTNLPEGWKQLPAYLLNRGENLKMTTLRRGNPDPEPDQLNLSRQLWLDFNGDGYTFKDTINGTITTGWRLEAEPLLDLGRVNVNNEPQFITRQNVESKKSGVEVRRGMLQLEADGRIAAAARVLPVAGWDKEFRNINTTLHLPLGWSVLYATGTDNQPSTFVQRWTLLDLFLALVISVAIGRLWHWRWGMVALATMVLIWHEPEAPHYLWLNLLIAIALVKVLPTNRFGFWIRMYRHMSLILLIVFLVPFLIYQARVGLHPQLEANNVQARYDMARYAVGGYGDGGNTVPSSLEEKSPAPVVSAAAEDVVSPVVEANTTAEPLKSLPKPMPKKAERWTQQMSSGNKSSLGQSGAAQNYNLIDPTANIQTGYGLPNWSWKQISLSWNGPIVKDQEYRIVLLSPAVNSTLNFIRIGLVAFMLLMFFGYSLPAKLKNLRMNKNTLAVFLTLGVLLISQASIPPVYAADNLPDENTLQILRDKLRVAPSCLPDCAHIPRMHISATANTMNIRLEIHSAELTAVPIPGHLQTWNPTTVLINGKAAEALQRDERGVLWIKLDKGVQQVDLRGAIPNVANFTIALPLIPNLVTHDVSGWRIDGVHQNGRVDSQLQFSRKTVAGNLKVEQSSLPPFVTVERTVQLGIDWAVDTVVNRVSPAGSAIVMKVPLLEGETVTSDINVQNNQVVVNMSPQQTQYAWRSSLRKGASLTLHSGNNPGWIEIWRADISPIWHVQMKGIAPVSHYDASRQWLPEWHPWPNENIEFVITRPVGVNGRTLTIDNSRVTVTTSKRASTVNLGVTLRSSQGGKHQFNLPEGAELQTVKINHVETPIRLDGRQLPIPISPGKQLIEIEWRQRDELGFLFKVPEIKLGTDSTNNQTSIRLGQDRWTLLVGGPRLGPAVLFWGVLIVLILISLGLARYKYIPLKAWHWFLLCIGLTQIDVIWSLIFVASFFVLAYRQQAAAKLRPWLFNSLQIAIAILMVITGVILINAIHQGLLGYPDMQIAGNLSSSTELNWFQDRSADALAQPWIISVSMIWYRGLMLAWALWLAIAVIRWSKWAWQCYASDGFWKAAAKKAKQGHRDETR